MLWWQGYQLLISAQQELLYERDVSGKEVPWLLNKNDMERIEGVIIALTSDLVMLFAEG